MSTEQTTDPKAAEAAAKAAADAAAKAAAKEQKAAEAKAAKEKKDAERAAAKAAKEKATADAKAEREAAAAAKVAAKEAAAKEKADAKAKKEADAAAAKAAKEAARMPEQNGVRRPGPNGLCGRVWALADKLSSELGQPVPIANLLESGGKEGLNASNLRTEYARWKKFHGLTGRISLPVAKNEAAAQAAA